eukprot:GHVS01066762.1.p1 GENE.GHVS01066762.1~~GHVS01066762.1.p1  ORF type:complete len:138 (+),score=7.57 GHVS01066762.1:96-509(+)
MKLSRCTRLGVLVAAVGTASATDREYTLGAGSIHLRETGQCSKYDVTLSLKTNFAEVKSGISDEVALIEPKRSAAAAETSVLINIDELMWSYREDETTAMRYDRGGKNLVVYTTTVPKREIFMGLILESGGAYKYGC